MREIKFRAWSTIDRKMLKWSDIFHLPAWEIFPGTPEQRALDIMQYTGLKDKNGVEIYEGDILKAGDELIYYVYYDEDYASFRLRRRNVKYALDVYLKCEVIGNIYENPELIGEYDGDW